MINVKYFDEALLSAFVNVIDEFVRDLVYNEYDFRAALYYFLRQTLENEKQPLFINFDYTLPVTSGHHGSRKIQPDIVIWNTKTEEYIVCGELKFNRFQGINKKSLFHDFNKLMKLKNQYGFQRSYFLCISKQSIDRVISPLINKHKWNREKKYSIKKNNDWVNGYLCVYFFSIKENQGFKLTFPNRVQITKI